MGIQEIIVAVIVILAVLYLVRYFYLQTKTHNCDDCGLMQMKKDADLKKQ